MFACSVEYAVVASAIHEDTSTSGAGAAPLGSAAARTLRARFLTWKGNFLSWEGKYRGGDSSIIQEFPCDNNNNHVF